MRNEIRQEIKKLCLRQFNEVASQKETDEKYRKKFEKRTGLPPKVGRTKHKKPLHNQFDPIFCKRNANGIATALWSKILDGTYTVKPAVLHFLDKADGSKREVMSFGIPDAAVASVLLRRTRDRNLKRFSPNSFAYHPDKNVFDAIIALRDFDHSGKFIGIV